MSLLVAPDIVWIMYHFDMIWNEIKSWGSTKMKFDDVVRTHSEHMYVKHVKREY